MRSNCISNSFARALPLLAAVSLTVSAADERSSSHGLVVFDAAVALTRGVKGDTASVEIKVRPGATVLVTVQENGNDVKLALDALAPDRTTLGVPVEVENNLQGEALELALSAAYGTDRLLVTLAAPPDTARAGTVWLRVTEFDRRAAEEPGNQARLTAFRAWTLATRADLTAQAATDEALPEIGQAIAIFEGRLARDAALAAMARLIRARILYYHELNPREARAEARRAASAFAARAAPDRLNAARARRLEAAALQEIALNSSAEDPTAAEADAEARRLFQELVADDSPLDLVGRARARNLLGLQDLNALAWAAARPHFEAALADYRASGNRTGARQTLRNLALLENSHGDYQRAAAAYDTLLKDKDAVTDPDEHATLLINAATSYTNAGRMDDALVQYRQAIDFTRRKDLGPPKGRALHGLGALYWKMGDSTQAESFFTEALRVRRDLVDNAGMFESLHANGTLAREAGDLVTALAMHREAQTRAPNPVSLMRAKLDLANDLASAADLPGAIKECREALAVKLEYANHPTRSEVKLALADFLARSRHLNDAFATEAAQLGEQALREALTAVDAPLEIAARRVLAELLISKQDNARAREHLERAIELALRYRNSSTNPELQVTALARHERTFRDYIDFEMRAAAGGPNAGSLRAAGADEIRALLTLESARAANFRANGAAPHAQETSRRLEALLTQLAAKRVRIATLLERASPPARQIQLLQSEMADVRSQIDRERLSAGSADARTAVIRQLRVPAMDADVLQLSYAMGVARGYLWARDHDGVRVAVLSASRQALERALDNVYAVDRIQAPRDFERAISRLAALLLPRNLRTRAHSIEIIADGKLGTAPFAAMLAATDRLDIPADRAVTVVTSMFGRARETRGPARAWRLVSLGAEAYGDGATPFPALHSAVSEGEAVREIVGSDAMRARIKLLKGVDASVSSLHDAWRQGADIVHIATHGLADLRQPLASLLAFPADERGVPTYLTAGQIQLWSGDVGLVYLSACETARGPERFAAGMPGLQQAFLHAGARYVIATLWPVEDRFAKEFALDFYRRLNAGASAPHALAATQRDWLASSDGATGQRGRRLATASAFSIFRE
jgi:CHAT domain-containing protein